jgi:hypothetical protein
MPFARIGSGGPDIQVLTLTIGFAALSRIEE